MHYQRWYKHGDPLGAAAPKPIRICSVDGCEVRSQRRSGYCDKHHARWVNNGDPLALRGRHYIYEAGLICAANGCDRPRTQRDWCSMHLLRWRRTGQVDTVRQLSRAEDPTYQDPRGYWVVRWNNGHPIAMSNGHIRRGRLELFNKIGLGPHLCSWCGRHIDWNRPGPSNLTVDHVNWDHTDDRHSNLVESCLSCNTKRKRPAA